MSLYYIAAGIQFKTKARTGFKCNNTTYFPSNIAPSPPMSKPLASA